MTTNAKLYVTAFLVLGMCVLMMAFAEWHLPDTHKFLAFFLLAITASTLKVAVPAMAGRMSFNFLFVLLGLVELTLPETLLIGCASVVIECVWRREGPTTLLDAYFSVANMAVAIAVANRVITLLAPYGLVPDWIVISLGTAAFFVFNTFPVAAVQSLTQRTPVVRIWKEAHASSIGWYVAGAALAWGFHRMSTLAGWQTALLGLPVCYLLYRTYRLYVARIEDEKVHAEELANLHMRTIEALALAIEAKDTTTSDHLRRVQVYAVELGRQLGMGKEDIEALRAAAVLHDIGKLAVPEYIISKPGKLTPEEFEKMKVHPVVGAEILEHVKFPYPVVPIVRAHHEKWNGTGYPHGLRGKEIPLGARILAVVDTLDALASDRQYRRALPLDEAMARVEDESGRSFDPEVVQAVKACYVELERKAQESQSCNLKLSTHIKVGSDAVPGAGFESNKPVQYAEQDQEALSLNETIAQARHDVLALFETGVQTSAMRLEEICSVYALRLKRLVPFEAIAIYLLRDEALVPVYVYGQDHRLFSSLRIPLGQGLSGWVLENKKPIINGNPSVESGYLNIPSAFSTLRSALSLPLEGESGAFGVVSLYRDARDSFTREHLRVMHALAPRLALAMEQAMGREHEDEKPQAGGILLDGTGLLGHLEQELVRCKRLSTPLSVLVCSVEGLGALPPQESGRVLNAVMHALEQDLREYDAIARTADSEFVVVEAGTTAHVLESKAARLSQLSLGRGASVAVGTAAYPADGSDAEQLLAAADRRLFRSRSLRRPTEARSGARDSSTWVQ
jgi:putative nucleotidyltransferase with HDIG domain